MRVVFDSSAFAKRYIDEHGSQFVDEICQRADQLGLCAIAPAELFSAVNRRRREGYFSPSDYELIKSHIITDLRDIFLLDLTPGVTAQAIRLLESQFLRAMDALHVACALEWQADLFVTADQRQLIAAQNVGLPSQWV
jgi:predicted nucleic acid-binding protein